jgi:hypothetical protein
MVVNFRVHGISRSTSKLALILPMLIKKKKNWVEQDWIFFFFSLYKFKSHSDRA